MGVGVGVERSVASATCLQHLITAELAGRVKASPLADVGEMDRSETDRPTKRVTERNKVRTVLPFYNV